jgi:ring-1,2-phenylacetyl-CoA epoxidase subunit PaaD
MTQPTVAQIWDWLSEVPDPEIPVISVVDLGIVREVTWQSRASDEPELQIAITPTYSGCPATDVISQDITQALRQHGIQRLRLQHRLAPAWTTDWISPAGHEKLRQYGIAPPQRQTKGKPITCPRCESDRTEKISQFGSTPCKAQYRCRDCLEPFDYFKCL